MKTTTLLHHHETIEQLDTSTELILELTLALRDMNHRRELIEDASRKVCVIAESQNITPGLHSALQSLRAIINHCGFGQRVKIP